MTKRLFIAVKITPDTDTLNHIYRIQQRLEHEKIKWVDTNGIHITLKFLGDTDEQLIPQIEQQLQQIATKHKTTSLTLQDIGVFPNEQRPRVLWIGTNPNTELQKLAQDIDNAMEKLGYEKEQRPFKPHITLGRIKFLKDKRSLHKLLEQYKDKYFQDNNIDQFILYESTLTPKGAKYTALKTFKLQ